MIASMRKLANNLLVVAVLSFACSGESDVKVTDFTLHECKGPAESGELATGRETADLAGLECVAWRFSEASTAIDLINRAEGCGWDGNDPGKDKSLWTPKLVQNDSDALTYSVSWEFEGPSACGACLHDFSITAKPVSRGDSTLNLTLETRSCTQCPWATESIDIPHAQVKEGIRCRYVNWDRARSSDFRGKLGGPTRDDACDEGLVAAEVEGDATLCLKACTSDDDCQNSLTACKDGACQLKDPW